MNSSIVQKKGYTWVVLPREGILPLTLLEQSSKGMFKRIRDLFSGAAHDVDILHADLFSLFPKPKKGKVPKIDHEQSISFFKGKDVVETGAGFDFKGLENFQAVNAGAAANISKARKLMYEFTDPILRAVNSDILLEEHLNIYKPETKAAGFLEKLQEGKIYVIVEVLQTKNFVVRDASDFEFSGEISADAIEGYLAKAGAEAHRDKDKSNTVAYTGDKPVTFALKASRILYDKQTDSYTLKKEKPATARGVSESGNIDLYDIPLMEID